MEFIDKNTEKVRLDANKKNLDTTYKIKEQVKNMESKA